MSTDYSAVKADLVRRIGERGGEITRLKNKIKLYENGMDFIRQAEDMDVADLKAKYLAKGCAPVVEMDFDHEATKKVGEKVAHHQFTLQTAQNDLAELQQTLNKLTCLEGDQPPSDAA